MAKGDQLARPVMRGGAGLHVHETRRHGPEMVEHLGAPQPCLSDHPPFSVYRMDLENLLGDVEPDDANLHFGRLLLEWTNTAATMAHGCRGAGAVHPINGKLRDECLNEEVFANLAEARAVIERWRLDYNHVRPHSAHGGLTPEAVQLNPAAGAGDQLPAPWALTMIE